jgi:hypothetical protein
MELNRNISTIKHPYADVRAFSDLLDVTVLEVDTTLLENEISREQKIARYVEEQSQKNVDNAPQLTPPAVKLTGEETSLPNLLAVLEQIKQNNSSDSEAVQSRLAAMKENAQEEKAAVERSWQAFKQEHTNLLSAKVEVEQMTAMMVILQANPNPKQADLDKAAKTANAALANVNVAMAALDANADTLLNTANQPHLELTEQIQYDAFVLNEILVYLHKLMKTNKVLVMQGETDLFKRLQDSLVEKLTRKANEIRAAQEKKEAFAKGMQAFGMALGIGIATICGGIEGGAIAIAVTVSVLTVDMATGGALTEKIIEPMLEPLMKGVEAIIMGISEVLKAIGFNEIAAMIVSVMLLVASVVGVAMVANKAADEFAEYFGKSIGDLIGEIAAKVATAIQEVVQNVISEVVAFLQARLPEVLIRLAQGIADVVKFVAQLLSDAIDWIVSGIKDALVEYLDDVLLRNAPDTLAAKAATWMKKLLTDQPAYLSFLKDMQNLFMAVGMTIEAGLTTATSFTERDEKFISAAITLTEADHEIIMKELSKASETWVEQLSPIENLVKLAAQLIASRGHAAKSVAA